jgi:hypothetical protein
MYMFQSNSAPHVVPTGHRTVASDLCYSGGVERVRAGDRGTKLVSNQVIAAGDLMLWGAASTS